MHSFERFFRFLVFRVVGLALILVPSRALSQTTDACGCGAVLMHGVFAYRAERGDTSATSLVERFLARTSWSELQRKMKAGGGLSLSGFGLSASTTQSQYEAHQASLRQKYVDWSQELTSREIVERYGDQYVLGAWATCKESCQVSGVSSWISAHDDHNLVLGVRWTPYPGSATSVPLSADSSVVGARIDGVAAGRVTNSEAPLPVGDTHFRLVRDDPSQPVLVHLRIVGMDRTEYVPPVVPVLAPPIAEAHPTSISSSPPAIIKRLRITTLTGSRKSAASDAKVYLLIAGSEHELAHAGNDRERNQTDVYTLSMRPNVTLSELEHSPIALRHDGTDQGKKNTTPDWHCARLDVEYMLESEDYWRTYASFNSIGNLVNRDSRAVLQN